MKSLMTCAAVLAALSVGNSAHARRTGCCESPCDGGAKACDCAAPATEVSCCRPTIVRPCERTYTYQRQVSCLKPPCCDDGCSNGRGCCRRGKKGCGSTCGNGGACGTSCGNTCDSGCGRRNRRNKGCCDNACDTGNACANCGDEACDGCDDNSCAIAKLIYESQTACYAKCRRNAIRSLSAFDCVCNPEIMSAFVYGLNDADERVRRASADAIAAQLRKNPCCCSTCVTNALTTATADCDKNVRRAAEKALCACGYDVIEPACETACCEDKACGNACANGNACATGCATTPAPAAAPAAEDAPVPAPAPPEEPKAFYQKPQAQPSARPASHRKGLKGLFGLAS
jgi:hypothetical protein